MGKAQNTIIIDSMKSPMDDFRDHQTKPKRHRSKKIDKKAHISNAVAKSGLEAGQNEFLSASAQSQHKLDELVEKTENVLYKARNIIPILASEVVIDTAKVTVIDRPFFFSERIHSVAVKDITDIYIDTVPFLASLIIVDSGFVDAASLNAPPNSIVRVKWLWKNEAERARRIITGLMESNKEKVDVTLVHDKDLASKLEEIGRVRGTLTSVSKA